MKIKRDPVFGGVIYIRLPTERIPQRESLPLNCPLQPELDQIDPEVHRSIW